MVFEAEVLGGAARSRWVVLVGEVRVGFGVGVDVAIRHLTNRFCILLRESLELIENSEMRGLCKYKLGFEH